MEEGVNELTSKLTCISNPTNVTKYYSVNVTGTSATQSPGTNIAPSIIPTPWGYLKRQKIALETSLDIADVINGWTEKKLIN